jgi:Na+/H+-dicarboxylate symporter/ABC-type amino acid transport substrate-binding protein
MKARAAGAASARESMARALAIGLGAGIATGLFVGEGARALQPVADGFIRLLQMSVLPYLTVSLVAGIGTLPVDRITRLGARAALMLVVLWTLALGCAFLMPLTFPALESATFFSTTMLERAPPLDLVDLYIPANPFFALANTIVPAVVLFSVAVGLALAGVADKQALLQVLNTTVETLARVMRTVTRLTPIGLFAIAATTAGTLHLDDASRLQIYLVAYAVFALLLALWILPGLVAALTPIPRRDIYRATRDALVTATIAGDLFIVLPLLIAACKELTRRAGVDARAAAAIPDVIVPLSFNFPHTGKLLSVSFVLFAGWFADTPVEPSQYPALAATAIVTLFGSITAAMPYLLDFCHIPADTFQLFVASGVINSRLGTLVAAMHVVALALVGTCAASGLVRWRRMALVRYALVTTGSILIGIAGMRLLGTALLEGPRAGDPLATMRLDHRASDTGQPRNADAEVPASAGARLEAITGRRLLRVAILPDALPFAFRNGAGELVGFDVALMHRLATELGVGVHFVEVSRDDLHDVTRLATALADGRFDLAVGGIAVTVARARVLRLSASYLTETMAFIVRDEHRGRFDSWQAIRDAGPLTIAVPDVPYYVDKLRAALPNATLRREPSIERLFATSGTAIALPAERGSAWTLRYPQYSVVVPTPRPLQIPLAFALPRDEPALASFVDTWVALKQADGTLDALYQYWILGRDAAPKPPRWSIVRDVLHWVD